MNRLALLAVTAAACASACSSSPSAAPAGAPPGPSAPAACEGTIYRERGTNRIYPSEAATTEAPPITGLAATGGLVFVVRGNVLGTIPGDRASSGGDVAPRKTLPPGATDGFDALAVDGDRLLWLDDRVEAMPLAGGAPSSLFDGVPSRYAVDGSAAYVATTSDTTGAVTLLRAVTGEAPVPLGQVDGRLLAARRQMPQDADAIYLTTWGFEGTSGVYRVAKRDGAASIVIASAPDHECDWVTVDDQFVYASCLNAGRTGNELVRASKTGDGRTVLAPSVRIQESSAFPIRQEDGFIYGVTGVVDSSPPEMGVLRIDVRTGAEETLVPAAPARTLTAFAKDGRCIYVARQVCTCLEHNGPNRGPDPNGGLCSLNDCTSTIERVAAP